MAKTLSPNLPLRPHEVATALVERATRAELSVLEPLLVATGIYWRCSLRGCGLSQPALTDPRDPFATRECCRACGQVRS